MITVKDFKALIETIDTPETFMREDVVAKAFQLPTRDARKVAVDQIFDLADKLDISPQDMDALLERAKELAPPVNDAFGRTEYTQEQHPTLTVFSARELQDKDITPPRFFVEGFLPQGLALLASPPKYGKSWFVLDLCLSVAAGVPFLGHKTNKVECLYLALEDGEGRLQDRMNKVLAGNRAPMGFYFSTRSEDVAGGLLEQLDDFLAKKPDLGLIVIDTLQKVRRSTSGKENAYAADYRDAGALKEFADRNRVCVLLVHHLRKMGDDGDPFNRISGTNGLFGAADTAMVMTREKRGDANTLLSISARDFDAEDSILTFNKQSFHWERLGSADAIEQDAAKRAYENSPIVLTLRELLRGTPTGEWVGTMRELMAAGQDVTGRNLAASPRELTGVITALDHDLFEYDHIAHRRVRNGTGGSRHRFYLSTVGSLPQTVGGEQQSMIPATAAPL